MQSMKRNRGALRAWLLVAALAALPLTTHAMSIRPEQIFRRDDTCGGDASLAKCAQSGLPDNFCCDAKGSECVVLAGATTVICCPGGKANCAVIAPIVCDLKLQDAEAYPGAQVKTTVLSGALPKCGGNCCPYGYRCVDGNCVMDEDQSKKPQGASPSETPVSSSLPSPTSEPAASSTASVSPGAAPSSSQPEDPPTGNGASAAIIGGAVAGGLMVILMIVAAVIVCRRRSKRQEKQSNERAPSALSMRSARNRDTKSGFFGCIGKPSTGPPFHISAPIGNVQRSDFNGKGTPSIGSTASVSRASFYRPSQEAAVRHDYWNSDGLGVPADNGGQSHHWARHASAVPAPIRPIRGMNHSGRSSARSSVSSIGHVSASAQHPPRQPSPESIQVRLDAQQYAAATHGHHPGYDHHGGGGAGRHRLAPPVPSSHLAPPSSAYDDRRDTTWTDIRDYASGQQD